MSVISFRLEEIPDLTLTKYQSLADTGVDGVLKRHESFLRQWHGICTECSASFHLLYTYRPAETAGHRMGVYLMLQGKDAALLQMEPLLHKSPLNDFFHFHPAAPPEADFPAGATLTKRERLASVFNPMTGQSQAVHDVPVWEMNENARLYDLFRMMETVGQAYDPPAACAFRVDLYPVSAVAETRSALAPVMRDLRGQNDIKLMRDSESLRADSYAQEICRAYEEWIESIETAPHFRVNLYSFADSAFQAKALLNAAGAEAISKGDFATAAIKPDADGLFHPTSRMGAQAEAYCFFPAQAALKSWSTTYSFEDAVPFFRLPALYDGETIEIPKETAPRQEADGIYLGRDMNGYPVNFRVKDLPRHAFFTGMPGAGKTNTMLHLATELRHKGIPFLALEPAKKEYRALLGRPEFRDAYLFSPHLQSRFPLRMNPLEFPKGVRLSEHINALLEVFEGSFTLEGPTYKFLSSAIQSAYTDRGWDIEDENDGSGRLAYPSLQDVYDNLSREIDASSYDGELKGNVRAFLQVRLGGLMERDAGELFNVHASTLKPDEWLRVSAVVELEVLGEQAKNFFVLLVCHYLLESLRADPAGGRDENGAPMPVRHVTFIEEAHNIIAPSTQQVGADSVDPKISATAYIVKMLAEVRALREAIIIADQLPTALAGEVTKNTGLKLVHRLTAQDDREQIGSAISASPVQMERMASFSTGRAFIYHERTQKPFEMQVAEWKAPKLDFEVSDDLRLYEALWTTEPRVRSTRMAFWCWKDRELFPLDDRVQALLKRYLEAVDLHEAEVCAIDRDILMLELQQTRGRCRRLERLWLPKETEHPLRQELQEALGYLDALEQQLALIPQPK